MSASAQAQALEAQTQAVGRSLLAAMHRQHGSAIDMAQEKLVVGLSDNAVVRTHLLRFIDVLADMVPGRDDARAQALARDYLIPIAPLLPPPLHIALRGALADRVPARVFARSARLAVERVGERFIVRGGQNGAARVLAALRHAGRYPSFDVLGEAVVSAEQAAIYTQRYLEMIAALAAHPDAQRMTEGGVYRLQLSVKLSALTPDFNPQDPAGTWRRLRAPFGQIIDAARRAGVGVTVDVEQYALRDLTWWIFTQMFGAGADHATWEGAGIVIQAYLRDSLRVVNDVVAVARQRGVPFQVRLVKGAYWDYETIVAHAANWPVPVFEHKWHTDAHFERLAEALIDAHPTVRTAIASHNPRSHAHADAVRALRGLPPTAVEHQTLYGMAPALSRALCSMGWAARDYVPIGDLLPGMAYLVRRLLENTSQVGFLMQSRVAGTPDALLAPPLTPAPSPDERPDILDTHHTFVHVPPVPFFATSERARFATALAATRLHWGQEIPLQIGERVVPTTVTLTSHSPSHPHAHPPVAVVHAADSAAVALAIDTARRAAPEWAARSQEERSACLTRAADLLLDQRDEVAAWIIHEGGKNWAGAAADVDEAIDYLRYYAWQALRLPTGYRPRGVVAVLPPWNFPIAIPCGMASAALAVGNTVILKSAEQTPLIGHLLVDLLQRAGIPPQALIHLPGTGETVGRALVASPEVDMIAFTGSRAVGLEITAAAAQVRLTHGGLKRVVAEMGGKNPMVVFADADPEEAAAAILTSAFGHANQKCSAASRVLIERVIFDQLSALVVDGARSLATGASDDPGTVLNPVINEDARARIRHWAEIARSEGVVLLDALDQHASPTLGLGPMIVALDKEAARTASIAQEEVFGPILALIPFDTEDEAWELANATVYGLTAGIFSRSTARARRGMAAIRAGNLYVNREITGARVGIEPFGGYALSGTGPKAGGPDYLFAFVQRQETDHRQSYAATPPEIGLPSPSVHCQPWPATSRQRAAVMFAAAEAMGTESAAHHADQWRQVRHTMRLLAGQIGQIADHEPSLAIAGQHTFTTWSTPRGTGLIVVDEGASLAALCGLMVGALLAGNGIMVAATTPHYDTAQAVLSILHGHGVPLSSALCVGDGSNSLSMAYAVAPLPIAFAGVSLSVDAARLLAQKLAQPYLDQPWLKALIDWADGPTVSDERFLHRFAIPKTIAIRTLRHGADLAFL